MTNAETPYILVSEEGKVIYVWSCKCGDLWNVGAACERCGMSFDDHVLTLESRLEKYEEALREIKALPSFPEVWDAERNMLTVSYPADAGPWHIARRALEDA